MMLWTAPDYARVLEEQLRVARLEMMSDPRLRAEEGAEVNPAVTARLIEEKLGAAASAGFSAMASSLRVDAQAALREQGVEVERARATLAAAAAHLTAPAPGKCASVKPPAHSPAALAGYTLGGTLPAAVVLYLLMPWHPLLLVLLCGAACVASGAAYGKCRHWRLAAHREVVRGYPSALCRQYMQALREGVAAYEATVRGSRGTREDAFPANGPPGRPEYVPERRRGAPLSCERETARA